MKVCGSTVKLQLILATLSATEVGGIRGVAVKMLRYHEEPIAKAAYWTVTDADARKCGYQTGLDTPVVRTVNDEYSLLAIYSQRQAKALSIPPGEYAGNGETQRIDGGPHKRRNMV